MRRLGALVLALAVATPALAALVNVPMPDGKTCLMSVEAIRCDGGGPIPTATPTWVMPTRTPYPTSTPTTGVAACNPGTPGNLNRPFESNPTVKGYDNVITQGREVRRFCAAPTTSASHQGTVSVAWLDSQSTNCSKFETRILSAPFPTRGETSGWSVTPTMPYKLLAPNFVAPPGTYWFEVESDSTACQNGRGR